MKTKIVYCIVSTEKDVYLEQAWVSIYTLRRYNADAHVTLLVDKATEATLTGNRSGIKELVDEVVAVDAPEGYNAMQRSRFLKTNFRQFLSGDLLFIDSDTAIGGSLADIDNTDADIACVPDAHCRFKDIPYKEWLSCKIRDIFGATVDDAKYYFNSGVIYVRDNEKTRAFFADWYKNWKYSSTVKKLSIDQPSLFVTDKQHGYMIKELSGIYNCQISYSLQYLYPAVILHFFNGDMNLMTDKISPFNSEEFFTDVRAYGGIKETVKDVLDDKTKWLNAQTHAIDSDHLVFLCTDVSVCVFEAFMKNSLLYRSLKRYCGLVYIYRRICKKLKKIVFHRTCKNL